jgi:hypothetical protein
VADTPARLGRFRKRVTVVSWTGLLALAWCIAQPAPAGEMPTAVRGGWLEAGRAILRVEMPADAAAPSLWDGDERVASQPLDAPPPPEVYLVVDASGSSGRILRSVRDATLRVMEEMPELRFGVVFFGSHAELALEPTADPAQVKAAFDAKLSSPGPSRNSISSGIGAALGWAAGHRRANIVVVTDGEDTFGPVDATVLWDLVSQTGMPIFGFPVGDRAGGTYLDDLASMSCGECQPLYTPADFRERLAALCTRLSGERLIEVPLGLEARAHSLRIGTEEPSGAAVRLYGPLGDDRATVLQEVLRADGSEERALLVAEKGHDVVSVGLTGVPVALAPGVWDIVLGTAPTTRVSGLLFEPGEVRSLEAIRLGSLQVLGPDLGRPDGTGASILTAENMRVLDIACGETAALVAGTYKVRVDTNPAWAPDAPFALAAGEARQVSSPGMGRLRVDILGEGGQPLDSILPVRDRDGTLVLGLRSGRETDVLAGRYEITVPVPKEQQVLLDVREGELTTVPLTNYGALLVHALGPAGQVIPLRLLLRDPEGEGRLVASGATDEPMDLRAGAYDLEVLSAAPYVVPGIAIEPGERTELTLGRFGALYATCDTAGATVGIRAEKGQWVGSFAVDQEVLLPAGTYRIILEVEGAEQRTVTIEAQQVTRVKL